MKNKNEIDYAGYGFKQDFGTWTRACRLCVCIVVRTDLHWGTASYGIYVTHGNPGGRFWRNSAPLVSCSTLEEAKDKAETLYGITGAEQFASIFDY